MQITMRDSIKPTDTITRRAISALFNEFDDEGIDEGASGNCPDEELQGLASGAPQRSLLPKRINHNTATFMQILNLLVQN